MPKKLKLYVWKDVLCDYTCGIMFALAKSPEHALEQMRSHPDWHKNSYMEEELIRVKPVEYTTPVAFAVWGGA